MEIEEDSSQEDSKKQKVSIEEKRTFRVNGAVDSITSFFVDPIPWVKDNLVKRVKHGHYIVLVAPSQTGKSTKVLLLKNLPELSQYRIVYLSAQGTSEETFWLELSNVLLLKETISSTKEIFRRTEDPEKEIILIVDEVDALLKFSENFKFFAQLRDIKHENLDAAISRSPKPYTLHSVIVVTNNFNFQESKFGESPFNVSDYIDVDYWTKEEVYGLFQQYQQERGILVDKNIVENIWERTLGAPGQTMMLGKYYDEELLPKGKVSYSDWIDAINFSYNSAFRAWIIQFANFKVMERTLKKKDMTHFILGIISPFSEKTKLDEDLLNTLKSANIIRQTKKKIYEVASPFVRGFVESLFTRSITHQKIPVDELLNIDFVTMLKSIVENLDIWHLFDTEQKKNEFLRSENAILGANEPCYRFLFQTALQQLYPRVSVIAEKKTESQQKCDFLLSFKDFNQKIAVEHCANVRYHGTKNSTLEHHVKSQAVPYATALETNQAWVIHWVTVPDEKKYMFDFEEDLLVKNANVKIAYIYHDPSAINWKIVSSSKRLTAQNQRIQLPVPLIPSKIWVQYGDNYPTLVDVQGINFVAELTDKIRSNPQVGVPLTGVILLYKDGVELNPIDPITHQLLNGVTGTTPILVKIKAVKKEKKKKSSKQKTKDKMEEE